MKVVVRADASVNIGAGHIMRCLALAKSLVDKGDEVCFLSTQLSTYLQKLITESGCSVHILPSHNFNSVNGKSILINDT